MAFTKLDYCQYLLSSQTNFTLTHLVEHLRQLSTESFINSYGSNLLATMADIAVIALYPKICEIMRLACEP